MTNGWLNADSVLKKEPVVEEVVVMVAIVVESAVVVMEIVEETVEVNEEVVVSKQVHSPFNHIFQITLSTWFLFM